MKKEKAVEVVKQLLKSAENSIPKMDEITEEAKQGYIRQAEAFAAKAKELMDKFNIEASELLDSASNVTADFLGLGVVDYVCTKELYSKNRQVWFTLFCEAVGCICTVQIQLTNFDTSCRIFAHDKDTAEVAKEMLDGLLKLSYKFYTHLNKVRKDLNLKRADYLCGFAVAVRDKALEKKDTAPQGLIRLSNSLTLRVQNLVLSQAGANKEVKAADGTKNRVDGESWRQGHHDGSHKDNVRVS